MQPVTSAAFYIINSYFSSESCNHHFLLWRFFHCLEKNNAAFRVPALLNIQFILKPLLHKLYMRQIVMYYILARPLMQIHFHLEYAVFLHT